MCVFCFVFQDLFIPITFRTAEGSLHAIPEKFLFEKVFPVSDLLVKFLFISFQHIFITTRNGLVHFIFLPLRVGRVRHRSSEFVLSKNRPFENAGSVWVYSWLVQSEWNAAVRILVAGVEWMKRALWKRGSGLWRGWSLAVGPKWMDCCYEDTGS